MPNEPCQACKEQLRKGRYDAAHARLKFVKRGEDRGHMFGGGTETEYVCLDCGTELIHSSDKMDPAWCR